MVQKELSVEQREELRQELAAAIKSGKTVVESVTAVAGKYGLSTVTVRWYLAKLGIVPKGKRGRPAGSKTAKRGPGRPKGSGKRGPGRPKGSGSNGTLTAGMVSAVQAKAAAAIKNGRAAQEDLRIYPAEARRGERRRKRVAQEQDLKRQAAAVAKALKAVAEKAGKVGDRIRALVEV